MSWYIQSGTNNGYPYNENFPTSFNTSWYADDIIQLPAQMWRIDNTNNGYPSNIYVPPEKMVTSWTAVKGGIQLPLSAYRIVKDIMEWEVGEPLIYEGTPYIPLYWFIPKETETDDNTLESEHDNMQIGGSKTNYGEWIKVSNKIPNGFNAGDMNISNTPSSVIGNAIIRRSLNNKAFIMSADEISYFFDYLRSNSITEAIENTIKLDVMQSLFGADIYNSIISCKVFPFPIDYNSGIYSSVKLYGLLPITYGEDAVLSCYNLITFNHVYNMGSIDLSQWLDTAWQFENCDYYLYLPCAGTYNIDLRSNDVLEILLNVDYLSGIGEYNIKQNGHITHIFPCNLAVDVPINFESEIARVSSVNKYAPVVVQGAVLGAGIISASAGEAAMSYATLDKENISQGLINFSSSAENFAKNAGDTSMLAKESAKKITHTQHNTYTCQSSGGLLGFNTWIYPRIIVKMPIMYEDAEGYSNILGVTKNKKYDKLIEAGKGNFIICDNYKTNLIAATAEIKEEINRLMNTGVFL